MSTKYLFSSSSQSGVRTDRDGPTDRQSVGPPVVRSPADWEVIHFIHHRDLVQTFRGCALDGRKEASVIPPPAGSVGGSQVSWNESRSCGGSAAGVLQHRRPRRSLEVLPRDGVQHDPRRACARLRRAGSTREETCPADGGGPHRGTTDEGVSMRLEVVHRGKRMRLDGYVSGRRLRLSLGTANGATAETWKNRIARALEGGRGIDAVGRVEGVPSSSDVSHAGGNRRIRREPRSRRSQPGPRRVRVRRGDATTSRPGEARDDDV